MSKELHLPHPKNDRLKNYHQNINQCKLLSLLKFSQSLQRVKQQWWSSISFKILSDRSIALISGKFNRCLPSRWSRCKKCLSRKCNKCHRKTKKFFKSPSKSTLSKSQSQFQFHSQCYKCSIRPRKDLQFTTCLRSPKTLTTPWKQLKTTRPSSPR